jgi:hypothetical protein
MNTTQNAPAGLTSRTAAVEKIGEKRSGEEEERRGGQS